MVKSKTQLIFSGTGTSQGVPVIACHCAVCLSTNAKDKRLRSSVVVQNENTVVSIDAGPDFRQQMLNAKVQNLDAVLVTHYHKDHIAGLDDVRPFMFKSNKPFPVYASWATQEVIKQEYAYAFSGNKYPGAPQFNLNTIADFSQFTIGDLAFEALPVKHGKMDVLGFKVGNSAYITDANFMSKETKKSLKKVEVLILNALQLNPHHSHFNLEQALTLIEELQPAKCYLTHISHLLGKHQEVEQQLPENVFLAYDGLQIDFP